MQLKRSKTWEAKMRRSLSGLQQPRDKSSNFSCLAAQLQHRQQPLLACLPPLPAIQRNPKPALAEIPTRFKGNRLLLQRQPWGTSWRPQPLSKQELLKTFLRFHLCSLLITQHVAEVPWSQWNWTERIRLTKPWALPGADLGGCQLKWQSLWRGGRGDEKG